MHKTAGNLLEQIIGGSCSTRVNAIVPVVSWPEQGSARVSGQDGRRKVQTYSSTSGDEVFEVLPTGGGRPPACGRMRYSSSAALA